MGTHVCVFSTTETVPSARELISWAAGKGHQLKINPERFDEEEEEQQFLAENLDSTLWSELSFANSDNQWVLNVTAQRKRDPDTLFQETMDEFRSLVAKAKRSKGIERVIQHLGSTQLLFDIQINVIDEQVWPAQNAVIDYFLQKLPSIALLENVDAFIDTKGTMAKL